MNILSLLLLNLEYYMKYIGAGSHDIISMYQMLNKKQSCILTNKGYKIKHKACEY